MELRKSTSNNVLSIKLKLIISLQIISVITPYMVGEQEANLGPKVFFVWGSLCVCCLVYAIFLIPETKGLSLEQVDRMFEESTPLKSAKWVPTSTYAADMGLTKNTPAEHIEV